MDPEGAARRHQAHLVGARGFQVLSRHAERQAPGFGREQEELYEKTDYHQASDELRETWDFSGAVEDVKLAFWLGCRVADAAELPRWNKGDEFEAARLKAVGETGRR
jgi:hypothetical protein